MRGRLASLLRGQSTVLSTSAYFPYGVHSFAVPKQAPGTYAIRLAATDLPGHFNRIIGTLQVSPRPRSPRPRSARAVRASRGSGSP